MFYTPLAGFIQTFKKYDQSEIYNIARYGFYDHISTLGKHTKPEVNIYKLSYLNLLCCEIFTLLFLMFYNYLCINMLMLFPLLKPSICQRGKNSNIEFSAYYKHITSKVPMW